MPTFDTPAALRQAAAGLTYPSETDAPWSAFRLAGCDRDSDRQGGPPPRQAKSERPDQ